MVLYFSEAAIQKKKNQLSTVFTRTLNLVLPGGFTHHLNRTTDSEMSRIFSADSLQAAHGWAPPKGERCILHKLLDSPSPGSLIYSSDK